MATIEKLVKAFEALKVFQPAGNITEDTSKKKEQPPTKKDKMQSCNIVADCICAQNMRSIVDFPKFLGIAIEAFLMLCNDTEADVRMVADECLNRTIKTLLETNLGRLQVELYKEIKKIGSSRSLRAALWRFADMAHLIRPQKCRPYIVNLLPYISKICRREEESVQETLSTAMTKLCPALMGFANDVEIKDLLKAFLPNLQSAVAASRRTAASSLTLICQYSRSPLTFISWLLNILLQLILPADAIHNVYCLLGTLLCLRHLMPHFTSTAEKDQGMKGSFGTTQKETVVSISIEQILQIYELLLHLTGHADHNVVIAALECLQQLLKSPSPHILSILTSKNSISRTRIYTNDLAEEMFQRTHAEAQDTYSSAMDNPAAVDDDFDDSSQISDSVDGMTLEERQRSLTENSDSPSLNDNELKTVAATEDSNVPTPVTEDSKYSNIEIADLNEDKSELSTLSHSSSVETLLSIKSLSPKRRPSLRKGISEDFNGNPELNVVDIEFEPPSPLPTMQDFNLPGIGSFTDGELPLLYCVRLLCRRFLLSGTKSDLVPDRAIRISVKTLALACIASSISLCPKIFIYKLFVSESKESDQGLSDLLLYSTHPDPQIKGQTALLAGCLIQATLHEGRGNFRKWMKAMQTETAVNSKLSLDALVQTLTNILEDDSSVAVRLSLNALQMCINQVLESAQCSLGLSVMLQLFQLKHNPYWLVKVELLELLSNIDFKVISYLESACPEISRGKHHFLGKLHLQEHMLHNVVIELLGAEDARVRHCAATCLVRMVPRLFYNVDNPQQDPVIALAKEKTDMFLQPILHEMSQEPPPLVLGLVKPYHFSPNYAVLPTVESSLSRIVVALLKQLNGSQSKHLTCGCCHALSLLSDEYLVTCYAQAWGCGPSTSVSSLNHARKASFRRATGRSLSSSSSLSLDELTGCRGGPLPIVISMLTSSPIALDLSTHQDTLQLAGNLMAGATYKCLRTAGEVQMYMKGTGEDSKWPAVSDRMLLPCIDQLMSHVARILNACSHVIDEQIPGPPQIKPSLPSLPNAPSLSPIKRKAKGEKDPASSNNPSTLQEAKSATKAAAKEKEKDAEKDRNKKDGLGTFYSLPQYVRIYEALKGAYARYKIALDLNAADKFCSLLKTALEVLSQVLEVATLNDIGKYAEEFLGYLKTCVSMEPTVTVQCVQQLLKSLFGTNLASQYEPQLSTNPSEKPGRVTRVTTSTQPGLYHSCFTTPCTHFTQSLAGAMLRSQTMEQEDSPSMLTWLRKRAEKKTPAILKPDSKADKSAITSYIRLFEPLVIKALKQYTVTSSLDLQKQVLNLLTQLVQLRVNYCLLDSDQIFIGFVIKQFEYIEEGQIRQSETLVPHIFHFLVMLSYEKFHTKSIIGIPKIIQLCDGIMASGLHPTTHAIPALQPIVQDLFLLRGPNKGDSGKDLETQREVVVSMLLRLIHYYQTLEMLILVLQQCHKEGEDKWKRLSRQVTDMVLPALAKQQLNIDNQVALDVLHRLFESVAPSVFRPVDFLLKTLLAAPYDVTSVCGLQRWMCIILVLLRVIISQSKEEVVMSRLQELGLTLNVFRSSSETSRSVADFPPEETLAWFLIQVVGVISDRICVQTGTLHNAEKDHSFLCQELAHFLLYVTHMFQSGLFRRVTTAAMKIVRRDVQQNLYRITEINQNFSSLVMNYPTLTLQWCNILILLNFDDQTWWSSVMQTPKKYVMASPSRQARSASESEEPATRCSRMEIVRQGSLILFCDYVCENLSDAEHMTWVVINHVNDLIELSHESPVQDFVSAIHRNSSASGLFIQAIHARCENLSKPSMVKKTLQCLEVIHLAQSGSLLTLLIDKFLNTQQLAVARICDTIACRRVEMLIAENVDDSKHQLPLEDLEKLLQFMKTHGLTRRHARLSSLLTKLRNNLCPDSRLTLSPEKTHPLAVTTTQITDIIVKKDLYIAIVKEECFQQQPVPSQCAVLLQKLDYAEILSVIMTKEFHLSILEECIIHGCQATQNRYTAEKRLNSPDSVEETSADSPEATLDPLFQAAQLTMFRHINNVINMLPVPHQLLMFSENCTAKEKRYREKIEYYFSDTAWYETVFHLVSALLQYLKSMPMIPWQPELPADSLQDICRFSIMCTEMISWLLHHNQMPTSEQLQTTLQCLSVVLQNTQLCNVIGQNDHNTWVCSATDTVYQLFMSLYMLPGERLAVLPNQDSQEDIPRHGFDDFHLVIKACDQISELIHCLKTHLCPNKSESRQPPDYLMGTMRTLIIGLARLPLVNSYARTPPIVWKMGWLPSPSGESKTKLPPLPIDYLQDKEVLREFMFRVNSLGWIGRQQFEETWMNLLGVLNYVPSAGTHVVSHEEEIEHSQSIVLAVKAITALLLQSTLTPSAGNPSNSIYETRPRDKPLAFLQTRCGKKLTVIRGIVEMEIRNLSCKLPTSASSTLYGRDLNSVMFDANIERELDDWEFMMGQISLESIWSLSGLVDSRSSDTPESMESPDWSSRKSIPLDCINRSLNLSGLDIHSCLQFLLELYGQWVAPTANPRTPLMLLNAVAKSIVCLSDLFTDRVHFEWMFDTLMDLHKNHPTEDELILQYFNVGLCKAAAVIGVDMATGERLIKMLDAGLKSTHLPGKVASLHGILYLLEAGMSDIVKLILSMITEFLLRHLAAITNSCITSQQYVLTLWATTFYVMENYKDELKDSDFCSRALQLATTAASSGDDTTSTPVYLAIIRGFERLLLAECLSKQDSETLVKLSVDRLCLPSPQRAMAALGLMLTCMYSGKQYEQYSPRPRETDHSLSEVVDYLVVYQDPETLILAMERITVLFDRIRKGFPFEARVITRILPTFLVDFFPLQDILNKVIGEFISSQQPHPQLIARVVFKVFDNLLQQNQQSLIREWVMLSLSNFTQRTPVAMATWSLTCFFISASTNPWLRALLPHVIGRIGKLESVDRRLFCLSALDFYRQLTDQAQKRAFQSTFTSVSQPGSPYQDLLNCCQ